MQMKKINTKLEPDQYQGLMKLAEANGLSVAWLLRRGATAVLTGEIPLIQHANERAA